MSGKTTLFHFVSRKDETDHGYDATLRSDRHSSTGKTTSMHVACSVTGTTFETWQTTSNALEQLMSANNDSLVPLDEIKLADEKDLAKVGYMLSLGLGKARMGRRRKEWCSLIISNGEMTFEEKLAEAGVKMTAGLEVRCISIESVLKFGVFDTIHDFEKPNLFAMQLERAAQKNRGVLARAFLEQMTSQPSNWDDLKAIKDRIIEEAMRENKLQNASGEYHRVLDVFALVAATGELAIKHGILRWPQGHAVWAIMSCFTQWVENRRLTPVRNEAGIKARVFAFLDQNAARFQERGANTTAPGNRAGFFERKKGLVIYYISREVFRTEVCAEMEYESVADYLRRQGILDTNKGRFTKRVRVPTPQDEPGQVYAIIRQREQREQREQARTDVNAMQAEKGS